MSSRLFDPLVGISVCVVAGVTVVLVATTVSKRSKLGAIPTVGSSTWLGSWWAGLKYLIHAVDVIQEGYEKHKSTLFKVAQLHCWLVVLSSPEHVEEVQKAPTDTLSFLEAFNDQVQLEYTMGHAIHCNPYHVPIIRSQLNRNLDALYPDIRDEITRAFDDILDLKGNEWKSVLAHSCVQRVICRSSNRVFVGLPLCRDPDWIDLNIRYTIDIVTESAFIVPFPRRLKPIAAWLVASVNKSSRRGRRLLGPIIEERQKYLNEHGEKWSEKPNDFLSWLMEEAEGPELTIESLTTRMLAVNFLSIHTTSSSFSHALFRLAANPQYIQPLREEVESVIDKEGWSKAALAKMRKIDSFLKECQRIDCINNVTLSRKALKDFTFSDGTFVPKGTMMVAATRSVHFDEALYENAHTFEPFRFADIPEEDDGAAKHQLVSTSAKYLPFGHGRQACPGRFFAAAEMKTMLAHIVVTYDVKLEDDATCPQGVRFVTAHLPNPRAKVMFRMRAH